MAGRIHHVSIDTADFDTSLMFYQTLFQMHIVRKRGEKPERIVWFEQGIQLCEVREKAQHTGWCSHIGMKVDDWRQTRAQAAEMGCMEIEGKPHWFITPDGVVVELKE